MVGGGADLDALRRWVRDGGFEDRVLIRGHVSRDRAVEEIRRNDAVIVSSVCYENAPMVIVEAAHYGTPSLVRAYGSLETFADDLGSKVLWHDDGTPEALSEALDALREKLRSGETYQTEPYSNQAYLETIHREFSNLVSAGE